MRIRAHTQRSTGKGEQKRKEHASVNTTAVQEAVRAGNEVGYMVPLDLGPAYADPEPRVPRQPERPRNSHSVIHTKQLPGPLAMQRLLRLDTLYELDEFHAVTAECAHTLYGRAMLMRDILPNRTTACGRTAAWVWVGGRLPQDYFEVLSSSHYRRLAFGRRIKAWQRQVDESQISTLNTLNLTTPLRTACDLAMYPKDDPHARDVQAIIGRLMEHYEFSLVDCEPILEECSHLRNLPQAREMLMQFESIA